MSNRKSKVGLIIKASLFNCKKGKQSEITTKLWDVVSDKNSPIASSIQSTVFSTDENITKDKFKDCEFIILYGDSSTLLKFLPFSHPINFILFADIDKPSIKKANDSWIETLIESFTGYNEKKHSIKTIPSIKITINGKRYERNAYKEIIITNVSPHKKTILDIYQPPCVQAYDVISSGFVLTTFLGKNGLYQNAFNDTRHYSADSGLQYKTANLNWIFNNPNLGDNNLNTTSGRLKRSGYIIIILPVKNHVLYIDGKNSLYLEKNDKVIITRSKEVTHYIML